MTFKALLKLAPIIFPNVSSRIVLCTLSLNQQVRGLSVCTFSKLPRRSLLAGKIETQFHLILTIHRHDNSPRETHPLLVGTLLTLSALCFACDHSPAGNACLALSSQAHLKGLLWEVLPAVLLDLSCPTRPHSTLLTFCLLLWKAVPSFDPADSKLSKNRTGSY